jgi:hypothetical protein
MSWVFPAAWAICIFDKGNSPKIKIGSTIKRTNHFRVVFIFSLLPLIYSGIASYLFLCWTDKINIEKLAMLTKEINKEYSPLDRVILNSSRFS